MRAYAQDYLNDVVENQGKLFDYVAQSYPDMDTEHFLRPIWQAKQEKVLMKRKPMLIQ